MMLFRHYELNYFFTEKQNKISALNAELSLWYIFSPTALKVKMFNMNMRSFKHPWEQKCDIMLKKTVSLRCQVIKFFSASTTT